MSVLLGIENRRTSGIVGVETYSKIAPQFYRFGDRQAISPSVLYSDRSTFFVGDKGQAGGFNNAGFIVQVDHKSRQVYYADIHTGTTTNDPLDHAVMGIYIENNYIYAFQTNPHITEIRIWKSNVQNDIRYGFTQISSVTTLNAYPQIRLCRDGKVAFSSRRTVDFHSSIVKSNAGIEGTYTNIDITINGDPSVVRHYNFAPLRYGVSTVDYWMSCIRAQAGVNYYSTSVFKTVNDVDFYNYNGTFTKDVSVSRITTTEMYDNYAVNGLLANNTEQLRGPTAVQINNDLYFVQMKAGTTTFYLFKLTDAGVLTDTILDIPNIDTSHTFISPFLYYNGQDILITTNVDTAGTITKEVWATDLDMTAFTQKHSYTSLYNPIRLLIPDNMHEVSGAYAFFKDVNYGTSTVYFSVTQDKFL
jgi:hypothetical protein